MGYLQATDGKISKDLAYTLQLSSFSHFQIEEGAKLDTCMHMYTNINSL